jgi:hypothetical protein
MARGDVRGDWSDCLRLDRVQAVVLVVLRVSVHASGLSPGVGVPSGEEILRL